jgi:hypothetical protein
MTNRRLLGSVFLVLFAACAAAVLISPARQPVVGVLRLPGVLIYWAANGDFESPGAFAKMNWLNVAFWATALLAPACCLLMRPSRD